MPQPGYVRLLELAQDQQRAVACGDLDTAVKLLDVRGEEMRTLPAARPADADVIREILRLDRELSSLIREQMIDIRNEAVAGRQGSAALSRYRPPVQRAARAIDSIG